jgi:hypothetical protein
MARKVFFSFHYDDVKSFRVNVVRNSWVVNPNRQASFIDGSLWESAKLKGPTAIRNLIDGIGLHNTSVTSVLIGEETHDRRWVKYEILKSFERGNGIFAIHVNRIRDKTGFIGSRGLNPLDRLGFGIDEDGGKIRFYELSNGRWQPNEDIPLINNKKSNTLYFPPGFLWGTNDNWGKFFKFSEFFPTYCWDYHDGRNNFSDWVEEAVQRACEHVG